MYLVGYPCINRSVGCTANRTFRIASSNPEHLEIRDRVRSALLAPGIAGDDPRFFHGVP